MTTKPKNDGGPAFPETRWDDKTRQDVQWQGMSMRDWLAGMAMQTLSHDSDYAAGSYLMVLAQRSYEIADAMLAERDRP